jgi:hypothetical protein
MIELIFIAFIITWIAGINTMPILLSWSMIPIYIATIFYITVLALEIFKVKNLLKKLMLLVWILPLISIIYFTIQYQLYIRFVIGIILFIVGVVLNRIACSKNDGLMPVFPNLSYCTKVFSRESVNESGTHRLGDQDTKLIPLTDIFDLGYNVFSIGDILIFSLFGIVMYGALICA